MGGDGEKSCDCALRFTKHYLFEMAPPSVIQGASVHQNSISVFR